MSQTTNKPATSMEELLKKTKSSSSSSLQKGAIVEGIITKLTAKEILVDISAKAEAVVLEKEKKLLRNILATLTVGDKVTVSILNPESEFGNPVVSLRRYMEDKVWDKLETARKNQEQIDVTVGEVTRGGFLVTTKEGASGFLPNSHTSFVSHANTTAVLPQELQGKTLQVYVLELNRPNHKIIFSQKAVMTSLDFEKATKVYKVGDVIEGIVSHVTSFGIFLLIQNNEGVVVDGLIHISEISWEMVSDVSGLYQQGQTIEAKVIKIDKEGKRLDLSIKQLSEDPFADLVKSFAIDQKVTGTVIAITSAGVTVALHNSQGAQVEGIIRKDKIPPTTVFEEGKEVAVLISSIDQKRHKILLAPVLKEKPIGYR